MSSFFSEEHMQENQTDTRILIVDDNEVIHEIFRVALGAAEINVASAIQELEASLFEDTTHTLTNSKKIPSPTYSFDSAFQGKEAIEKVIHSMRTNSPYSTIFMDIRMP